jgi:hypothetical protein
MHLTRALGLVALLPSVASAGDLYVTHQGRLLDVFGRPVYGTHDLRVSLYDAETGGSDVWRDVVDDVSIQDGYFTLTLTGLDDTGRDFDAVFAGTAPRFVAVAVDTPYVDLGPRARLGSTSISGGTSGGSGGSGGSSFALVPIDNADANTWYTSNAITLDGPGPIPVVILSNNSAEIVHNGIPTGTSTVTGRDGDTIAVRMLSWDALGGDSGTVLHIGPDSYAWTIETGVLCEHGSRVFTYSGAPEAFTVPLACNHIDVVAWGAGGAGGTYSTADVGGGGGFAYATLAVTPGEPLTVVVGGGGVYPTGQFRKGGGGGGASSVLRGVTTLLAVGGGGGASGCNADGGGGGHPSGADGATYGGMEGRGGTQSAGGAGGANGGLPGTFGQGGQGHSGAGAAGGYGGGGRGGLNLESGGGGGGGWYGGGGGGATSSSCGGGGGGGSTGGDGIDTLMLHESAVGAAAPQTSHEDYAPGVAVGGVGGPGGPGRIVVRW